MQSIKDKKLWGCIILILGLGFLSGLSAINAKEYYGQLVQPSFAPSAKIFAPVWTILYILMGISLYHIINHKNSKQRQSMLLLFIIQLIANVLWTFIFFSLKLMLASVIDIVLLWIVLLTLVTYSFKYLSVNAILLLPYFLWVSFAALLNISIGLLN